MDAHPAAGLVVGLAFLVVGIAAVSVPGRIQGAARNSLRDTAWEKLFAARFVESDLYVPGMRVMGWVFILAALFVLTGSVLALFGIIS